MLTEVIGGALGAYGSKPKVPNFNTLNLSEEQKKAIEANQANLPGAADLASNVNRFNQQQLEELYALALPGYQGIKKNIAENIAAQAAGEIPQDVQNAIQNASAARSLGGGFAGTGMQRNLVARDLGLTSLDLTSRGMASAQQWLQTATAPRFDLSSMFISPAQQATFAASERDAKWNSMWLKNQISAAPDPSTLAMLQGFSAAESSIMSMAGSAAGAAGGGGGGL